MVRRESPRGRQSSSLAERLRDPLEPLRVEEGGEGQGAEAGGLPEGDGEGGAQLEAAEGAGAEEVAGQPPRGAIVDEPALIDALQAGRIAGAALDVFTDEPRVAEALRTSTRTVLTPHIASSSVPTRMAMANLAADNLIDFFAGREVRTPINTLPLRASA